MPGDRVFKKGVLSMEKFKRSAFLIVMGTAILLFMSGCGMKKRTAVMSGESLSQTTEISPTEKVVPQSAGIPLREESLTQEDIGLGNSGPGTTETASVPPESDVQEAPAPAVDGSDGVVHARGRGALRLRRAIRA